MPATASKRREGFSGPRRACSRAAPGSGDMRGHRGGPAHAGHLGEPAPPPARPLARHPSAAAARRAGGRHSPGGGRRAACRPAPLPAAASRPPARRHPTPATAPGRRHLAATPSGTIGRAAKKAVSHWPRVPPGRGRRAGRSSGAECRGQGTALRPSPILRGAAPPAMLSRGAVGGRTLRGAARAGVQPPVRGLRASPRARSAMPSWVIDRYGRNDVLRFTRDMVFPTIDFPNEVIIKVHAASLNPIDLSMRSKLRGQAGRVAGAVLGLRLPRVPPVSKIAQTLSPSCPGGPLARQCQSPNLQPCGKLPLRDEVLRKERCKKTLMTGVWVLRGKTL